MQEKPQLQKRSSYMRCLGWLVLALFAALLVFPKTRRLIQIQLGMETLTFSVARDVAAELSAATRLRNDYPVQLALANGWGWTDLSPEIDAIRDSSEEDPAEEAKAELKRIQAHLERIAALVARFPDRPSAYAARLNYMVRVGLTCREDPYKSSCYSKEQLDLLLSPDSLQTFLISAQQGAQLDPENAYFPMMRAVGLFAAKRDTEALESLQAAAHCSRWNDYASDEVEGLDRLQCEAYGDRGAAQRIMNSVNFDVPHYNQIRAVVDRAIDASIAQEKAGNYAQGIAIRLAVMRCGSLIRSQAASNIALLVGDSSVWAATRAPVGILPSRPFLKTSRTAAEQQAERRKIYFDYLESQGMAHEAKWAEAELAAGEKAKATRNAAMDQAGPFGKHFFDLSLCWLDNLSLLGCALVLLILGGAAHLATTMRQKRKIQLLRAAYVLAMVGGIWCWQWLAAERGAGAYIWSLHAFTYAMGTGVNGAPQAMYGQWVVVGLCALTPVALIGLIGAISLRQRVPLAAGIGRGLRGIAVPAALILMLLYGISLLPTARTEADLNRILIRAEHNEVQELMERSHKPWPLEP